MTRLALDLETVYVCQECDAVSAGFTDLGLYECGECGSVFAADSNRCEDCNKFATREADRCCEACEAGAVEETLGFSCICADGCDAWHVIDDAGGELIET